MNRPADRVPLLGLGAALIIIGCIAGVAYISMQGLVDRLRWVVHTQEVLRQTEVLVSDLKDVETSVRGYLIAGHSEFLIPYKNALVNIPARLSLLKELTSDNADQAARVRALEQLTDNIGIVLRITQVVARLAQTGCGAFSIGYIHLAAECFYVDSGLHCHNPTRLCDSLSEIIS